MKRLRDDGFVNPQYKRPFGPSRGELNGLPNPQVGSGVGNVNAGGGGSGTSTGATQKLTTNDALTYLKDVKDMFQDQREKYDCFLDVMKDFKAQRIDTAGVIGRVKELFKGHPNLILGFNTFLPKGYEIPLNGEEETPKRTVEFEEAISFVNKIKKRFEDDERVYKSFLDILNMYRKEHKGIKEAYQEVAALFDEHQDLLDEFTKFVPDTSGTESAQAYHSSLGRHSFHRYDEMNSGARAMQQSHADKLCSKRDVVGPHGEQDLSVECSEMDDQAQKKQNDREDSDRRSCDQDRREPDTENDGDASIHWSFDKKRFARKLDNIGGNSTMKAYDDKDPSKSVNGHEFSFCDKVKERLKSPDDYQTFLKCLNIYNRDIITKKELQSLVNDLLGKYPDLMDPFNEFLERSDRIDGLLSGVMSKKTIFNEESASKLLRIEEKYEERNHELEGGKEKDRCNLKYWGKSIQELDLSNCQRCSPSYRLLPDDYPIPTASQRSELGNEVLNDHWVSVTSGSEDYSFKHMRRNHYEESLFRCEDDRFELDMLLESVSSTTKRVVELSNCLNNKSLKSDGPIRIEDHFTALNLRCIERLYGDHGLDAMDILHKNPSLSLPVILTRLKQKQEEWTKCRSKFNEVWAEIYSKNYYKSLDHRSFYFKQQDAKNLSTKSLVAEIKEMKDKKKKEDDVPLDIGAGSRNSITADLEFEYANTEIHEDVYKIIRYSCEEVCSTKEQVNKVLRLWTTFLEPMLGIQSQQHSFRTTDYDVSSKRQVADTMISMMGSEGSPSVDANTNTSFKQPSSMCNSDSTLTGSKIADVLAEGHILASIERSGNTDVPVVSGSDANRVEESNEGKHVMEDIISLQGTLKSSHLTSGKFSLEDSQMSGFNNDSVDPCKNEREEGELSPNGDFEGNVGDNQDGSLQDFQERNFAAISMQCEMGSHEAACGGDVFGENEADDDDDDFKNASEAGEDVSGSESATDEGSRDEHDEEVHGEHDLDCKPESEGEAKNTSEPHDIGADGATFPQSESFVQTCKPLSMHVASSLLVDENKAGRFFYGNDSFYVLFRLHQLLYERILSAKVNSTSGEFRWRATSDSTSDGYTRFMSALLSLLDGSSDNAKFEDDCRSLIGNQSYVLYTLDKLIYRLVKQLQTISSDEVECKLLQLYEYESCRRPEKRVDSAYCENAHVLLHDENMYRLECQYSPTRLLIQIMDGRNEKSETVAVSVDPNFASHLQNDYFTIYEKDGSSMLMLKRNLRMCANLDESSAYMATEKVIMMNGLESKMAVNSFKISYVLDTEDYFIHLHQRPENRPTENSLYRNQSRVQRFHRILTASLISLSIF